MIRLVRRVVGTGVALSPERVYSFPFPAGSWTWQASPLVMRPTVSPRCVHQAGLPPSPCIQRRTRALPGPQGGNTMEIAIWKFVRYFATIMMIVAFPPADPLLARTKECDPPKSESRLCGEAKPGQMESRLTGRNSSTRPVLCAACYSVGSGIPESPANPDGPLFRLPCRGLRRDE
jgi:hypothetical protein